MKQDAQQVRIKLVTPILASVAGGSAKAHMSAAAERMDARGAASVTDKR